MCIHAHMQPGLKTDVDCSTTIPEFQSYHIHTLFWTNNADSIAAAESILTKFGQAYNVTYDSCKYNPGDLDEHKMCIFDVRIYITSSSLNFELLNRIVG